ncbi:hypothetical protein ASD54_21845 [Rhizobium sp. Root149]|uniref:ABC transporter substrate-binding protein n=1 Tax=Rhizobium sp. Root149 TaxID=1736473 RepID=UPI00071573AF|nr:ABC transporter substrate-binding protein [Rhizobium sp. Root149]KQZ46657.1 hypothetical protein ASD54_21845 [Rhizobium sp. Root149]
MSKNHIIRTALVAGVLAASFGVASAEVKVGVIHALSGSAASQGISQNQAIQIAIPKEIGGEKVRLVILDDAGDPAIATRNAKKLIEEEKVDVLLGPTTTPAAIAIAQVASSSKIALLPAAPVTLGDARDEWLFNIPPPPMKWIVPIIGDMKKRGVKTVGFIGFSDAWGDISLKALQSFAEQGGYKIITDERYARSDTSVTGQVLRVIGAKPDAVFLGVSGSPGVLANVTLNERGYAGPIYNGNGIFNKDFLSLGGSAIEGIFASVGAIAVGDQLPDNEPRKAVVRDFFNKFNSTYGKDKADAISGFGYDSGLLATQAIEKALKKAKPGTPEFRVAVRDGMREIDRLPGTHSIYTFADPKWPWGVGDDATFLVTVKGGNWTLAK